MVALPLHSAPPAHPPIKEKPVTLSAFFRKMTARASPKRQLSGALQEVDQAEAEELQEEEEELQEQQHHLHHSPFHPNSTQITSSHHYLQENAHYSLNSASSRTSRSAPSSSITPSASAYSRLWAQEDDIDYDLPPVNICDHIKTLLSQLAASVSALNTAYTHQQAALNPYNVVKRRDTTTAAALPLHNSNMEEELERLSVIHRRLTLLQNAQQDEYHEKCGSVSVERRSRNIGGGGAGNRSEESKDEGRRRVDQGNGGTVVEVQQMMRRYEGIITRFHDEIRRKDAIVEALKETLAKSMLQNEKLQRRVTSLETKLAATSRWMKAAQTLTSRSWRRITTSHGNSA